MSSVRNILCGLVAGLLVVAACGGGDSGGGGNGPNDPAPTQAERNTMAAALDAAAVNAQAAGDALGVLVLKNAAGLVGGNLTVTQVTGVTFARSGSLAGAGAESETGSPSGTAALRIRPAHLAGNGWAFGLEIGIIQSAQPLEVGAYEGALVISGSDIAYGLGLTSATPGYTGSSFGGIWSGANAGWSATQLTGFGVVDSVIGGDCLPSVPAGYGITMCTRSSHAFPGFNITASAPMNFPGNTAAGSNTMTFAPSRLRGGSMTLECAQTTFC